MRSPTVRTCGGSFSTKNGRNVTISCVALATRPSSVDAIASTFHVVRLSASGTSTTARPEPSSSISGFQSSVSGKYWRRGGVAMSGRAPFFCSTGSAISADVVCRPLGWAATETDSVIEPTSSSTSRVVDSPPLTGTCVTT